MAEFREGAKVKRWKSALVNPLPALRKVGAIMVSETQERFRLQAMDGQQWAPRGVPNVYAILKDFAEGRKEIPKRRFQASPVLKDTGRLSASIDFRVVALDTVEVGTRLPYAGVHQKGGKIESARIDSRVRGRLKIWLRKQSKKVREQLGWLLNKKFKGETLQGEVEARPFLGVTDQTIQDVQEIVGHVIFEVR